MFTKSTIENYFLAEKSESLVFMIIGIVAITGAAFLYLVMKTNFHKGMALPFILIAFIQITVGYTVYKRSDEDRKRNTYAYDLNPADLKNREIPRMEKVNRNFMIYRWVEIALIVAGLILVFLYRQQNEKTFWYGLGMGLAIQAAVMLSADYFAEARAKKYLKGLVEFTK